MSGAKWRLWSVLIALAVIICYQYGYYRKVQNFRTSVNIYSTHSSFDFSGLYELSAEVSVLKVALNSFETTKDLTVVPKL